MAAAGLVNDDGTPILPTSPEELLEHARMVEEATGQDYLAADFAQFPIGVRLVLSLMWQQGENIFTEDGTATVDTEAARNAVTAITQLFDAGYANPQLNYADSQQAFLNGEAAVLVNGTWVVDFYASEAANPDVALSTLLRGRLPDPLRRGRDLGRQPHVGDPGLREGERARDLPGRAAGPRLHQRAQHRLGADGPHGRADLGAGVEDYANLPHRDEYAGTAAIARDTPPSENYGAIQDVLNRELQAIWLTGKSLDDALADAELEVQDLLDD
jgi:multiple sugar transport system substrate-binding protein